MKAEASTLLEIEMATYKSVITLILRKVPEFLRVHLYSKSLECTSWDEYRHQVEILSRITFSDAEIHPQISSQIYDVEIARMTKEKKFTCLYHGKGTHSSNDCDAVKEAVELFKRNQSKSVKQVQSDKQVKKSPMIYSSSYLGSNNPFIINVQINGIAIKALLDTGADVSIVPYDLVKNLDPKKYKIMKPNYVVRSVSGSKLKTLGQIHNICRNRKIFI